MTKDEAFAKLSRVVICLDDYKDESDAIYILFEAQFKFLTAPLPKKTHSRATAGRQNPKSAV